MNREQEAAAFIELWRQEGRPDWQEAFVRWSGRNRRWGGRMRFRETDFWAVRKIVRTELIARGHLVPMHDDWFTEEAA